MSRRRRWRAHWPAMRQAFGRKRQALARHPLTVDLGRDIFSQDWWRGLGTLSALCLVTACSRPTSRRFPAAAPSSLAMPNSSRCRRSGSRRWQWRQDRADGWPRPAWSSHCRRRPSGRGSSCSPRLGQGDSMLRLLGRSGATYADAEQAAAMIAAAAPSGIAPDTSVAITLGRRVSGRCASDRARGAARVARPQDRRGPRWLGAQARADSDRGRFDPAAPARARRRRALFRVARGGRVAAIGGRISERRWRPRSMSAAKSAPTTASTWSSPTAAPRPARISRGRCSTPGSTESGRATCNCSNGPSPDGPNGSKRAASAARPRE